ncbi:MAG: hypothetical protein VYB09_04340 [Planctomycetota bacterium]|nr:hypothetical protein [Planctomycetota bacterium]
MLTTIIYVSLAVLAVAGLGLSLSLHRGIQRRKARIVLDQRRLVFMENRESLQQQYFEQASSSGKPRGLEWVQCEFESEVTFARDRHHGQMRALVGITIQFAAIEGGDMEDVEAVGNLRAGTAVFLHDGGEWFTDGRILYNLDPDQALAHFADELEVVGDTEAE